MSATLSRAEAAKLLHISQRTLWALSHPTGPIPTIKIGRRILYLQDDVEQFLQSQRRTHESEN